MRNLLIFITKYNAFFLFIIFEISALLIYIKYNSFQKATFINSANVITGNLNSHINGLYEYLKLREVNENLAFENARLRNQLKSSFYIDTLAKRTVNDTVYKQQYTYVGAKVINNTTNRSNNYITIDRGKQAGIVKGMGVISGGGLVGKIIFVSDHLAIVQSLLHKDSRFSAMLAKSKEIGYVEWSDDLDPHKGIMKDISNNAQPKLGDLVITSEYSLFPAGILIGKISNLHSKSGGLALNVDLALSVDFNRLQYVDVVINKFAAEQTGLEALQKKDE